LEKSRLVGLYLLAAISANIAQKDLSLSLLLWQSNLRQVNMSKKINCGRKEN